MKVQEGPEEKKLYRKWNIFFCTVAQNRNVYTLKGPSAKFFYVSPWLTSPNR